CREVVGGAGSYHSIPSHSSRRCHQLLGLGGGGGVEPEAELVDDVLAVFVAPVAFPVAEPLVTFAVLVPEVAEMLALVDSGGPAEVTEESAVPVERGTPVSADDSVVPGEPDPEREPPGEPGELRGPMGPVDTVPGGSSASMGGGVVKWISRFSSSASKPISKPLSRVIFSASLKRPIPDGRMRKTIYCLVGLACRRKDWNFERALDLSKCCARSGRSNRSILNSLPLTMTRIGSLEVALRSGMSQVWPSRAWSLTVLA